MRRRYHDIDVIEDETSDCSEEDETTTEEVMNELRPLVKDIIREVLIELLEKL